MPGVPSSPDRTKPDKAFAQIPYQPGTPDLATHHHQVAIGHMATRLCAPRAIRAGMMSRRTCPSILHCEVQVRL